MSGLTRSLASLQRRIEEGLCYVSAVAVGAMMVITVAEVGARWLFRKSVPGSYEYVSLLFVYLIFLGLTYAQRRDAHISVGIVYDRLTRRSRKIIEGVLLFASFALFAALTWYSGVSAWENYLLGDTILGAIQVETWPARAGIPIGCGMLALRLLVQLSRLLRHGELYEEAAREAKDTL